MTSRPLDTDAAAWSAQNAALDRMGGPARLRAAIELSEAVREIRLAGIQACHPDLGRREVIFRLVREEYGVELPDSL
jgi:hypothetical protein